MPPAPNKTGVKFLDLKLAPYTIKKLQGKRVATVTFSGRGNDIYVSFTCKIDDDQQFDSGHWLSIDQGVTNLITGVTDSGEVLQYTNQNFKRFERSINILKSKHDKKTKYSRRYNKLKATCSRKQKKLTNRRKNYHHVLTKQVVDFCIDRNITTIIHGDINTKKLVTKHKGLNGSTQNRGSLSRVKSFLAYKAKQAGISHVLQDEAYTSKTNCYTGEIMRDMTLGTRQVEIDDELWIDRDVNGAINIAIKYHRLKAKQNQGAWLPHLEWLATLAVSKRYVVC